MKACPCCHARQASAYYLCKCGWVEFLYQKDDVMFRRFTWAQCYHWDMELPVYVIAPKHVRVKAWAWWSITRLPVVVAVALLYAWWVS